MNKFIAVELLSVLLFAVDMFAQTSSDFDDQKPVKKVQEKTESINKTEEAEAPVQVKKTEEPVKPEEAKPVEESGSNRKNLHPGFSEDESFEELLKDIRAGNLEHADSLISTFPKLLNRQDKFGHTPIFNAVSANQYPIAEMLVKMNADIKLANVYGDTPLHKAAQSGEIKVLELLLKSGAQIWKNNIKGESPLSKAVSAGRIGTVKFLIENRAELNTPDNKGDTPLHKAAVKGDKDIVKLLLDSGADAGIKNKENMKPADLAKKTEIRQMLEAREPAFKR
ncbi:MAG: ankyrin repeat domain-containing protein [Victivallales bacterium]|jgi:ankyrin repeat protein